MICIFTKKTIFNKKQHRKCFQKNLRWDLEVDFRAPKRSIILLKSKNLYNLNENRFQTTNLWCSVKPSLIIPSRRITYFKLKDSAHTTSSLDNQLLLDIRLNPLPDPRNLEYLFSINHF